MKRKIPLVMCVLLVAVLTLGVGQLYAQGPLPGGSVRGQVTAPPPREAEQPGTQGFDPDRMVTQEERQAAADRAKAQGLETGPDSVSGDRQYAVAPGDTPDYFGMPNYANSPLPEAVTTFTTFYFAEGTCRPNFDPFLCIQNPGAAAANVTITYMKGDGTTAAQDVIVNPHTRLTVLPSSVLGEGDDSAHDFGTTVECTNGQQVFVERPMYFNYKEKWTGGHDVMGATSLDKTFYFAEGYTASDLFEEWLTLLNPAAAGTKAHITYMFNDGSTQVQDVDIGPTTRLNVNVNEAVGLDREVSTKIEADTPIIAERPMYFNYRDKWTGGHDVIGSKSLGGTFYFAEGYTGADTFEEWLTIQNPGAVDANLDITYQFSDSSTSSKKMIVGPTSRATVNVNEEVGVNKEVSVKIQSDQPILAERPMYFNYNGTWTGGHDVVGAIATDTAFSFAEGTCRTNFDPYITIQNPGQLAADVTITYMKGDGTTATDALTVPASTRSTVKPRDTLGTGDDDAHDFSSVVECTNGQQIVAERPMYFNYGGAWTGGHNVMGFSFAANLSIVPGTGMRKFVDSLPGLTAANANNLGQYLPVAIPDKTTYPGSDYYEIELNEYTEQLHSDLPPTTLRGYRQTNTTDPSVSVFNYLGPTIVAERDVPVRVKFTNNLPMGAAGDLFIPVDTTVMGAGMGPNGTDMYMQNRGTLHLHGGFTPWISDGTPHQWTTPVDDAATAYPKGVSVEYVPDMWFDANGDVVPEGTPGASNNPGPGRMTFFYTNQQSARLMFYHDHAWGITRLNVYAGEAAPYILQDPVEKGLVDDGTIPADQIPLVIQDKTFVPDAAQLQWQDPTWDTAKWGDQGDLWFPHVYMPNQNPADPGGMNAFARWHYGPWFWPPTTVENPPVPNPYYDPVNAPWENETIPGVPDVSSVMEAFMDTPMVNGTAYPTLTVDPKAYRLRVLNAADDRFFNLQLYEADPTVTTPDGRTGTEVRMVPAAANPAFPEGWPTDGREGGVPDPALSGPEMIQIGTEGGFLPYPAVLPNQPVTWNNDPTTFNFGIVSGGTLILGPAERGDVVVDFSAYAGKTLILYNDSPAPFPALDPRYDYYTGAPDLTDTGGVPAVYPGYGPNTRTIMQIKVAATAPAPAYDLAKLEAAFASTATTPGVFAATQEPIIMPSAEYNSAYNGDFAADPYVRIYETQKTFQTLSGATVTIPFQPKAIQDEMGEAFDTEYGRMSGFLGLELANTGAQNQNFLLYPFSSPPVDITMDNITPSEPLPGDNTQVWKITHNGVDTHPIHFHLFNVQLINRVAWDNSVSPPDPNELGWKETVRVNPLEDTIVALRPYAPDLPFEIPDSIRPINPAMPVGSLLDQPPPVLEWQEPGGTPVITGGVEGVLLNDLVNFGWEYVLHCHLLSHEEMDMMHGMCFTGERTVPVAPDGLAAVAAAGPQITLTWNDNSTDETHFIIQRTTDPMTVPWETIKNVWTSNRTGTSPPQETFVDTTVVGATTYYYRVIATNAVGYLPPEPYTNPEAVGFPTVQADSTPSAQASATTP